MALFGDSLRIRLLLYFLSLALIVLGLVGFISYRLGRSSITASVESHLESVAVLKEQEITSWIEHLQHTFLWLSTNPRLIESIRQGLNQGDTGWQKNDIQRRIVREFQRVISLGHYSEIFLLDKQTGKILVASKPKREGKLRNFETYFQKGLKEVFISEFFLSLTLERPTMVVSGPVVDKGEPVAVLVAHANLNNLNEIMLERTGLGESGETYLVNQSNLMLTNTIFAPNAAFKKWSFTRGVKLALEGQNGIGEYRDYRNIQVIAAYRWLDNSKLALITKQDQAEAFAPVSKLRHTIFAIAAIMGVLVLLLSQLISRSITRPIHQIVNAAKEIGEGNLQYRINSSANDEFGLLAGHFDSMSENLDKITISRMALTEKVRERTEELTKAHQELLRSEKMAVLGQLAGGVAHELRNPLGVISNAVYYLKLILPKANLRVKRYLSTIELEVMRSSKIVSDLLNLFGAKPVKQRQKKVSELLNTVLATLTIPDRIELISDIPSHLPLVIVDAYQVSQVFHNLITNAIQAMPDGGKLLIKGSVEHNKVLVSFTDTGEGVLRENSEKIFKPLFTTKARGIGLGLAVSKKFVEANRGNIRFFNVTGGGSSFIVDFPTSFSTGNKAMQSERIGHHES